MKNISILIFMLLLFSCNSKTESKIKTSVDDKKEKPISIYAKKQVKIHTDTLSFIDYNDDGDYYLLSGFKNKKYYQYINDNNEDRSFLRGDIIEIKWKNDTIIIAGDGDTPQAAEWIVSAKKIKDGKVSEFRKSYKKLLKYNWSEEDNYSQSYLEKLFKYMTKS